MQSHNLRYLCNSVHLFIGVFATHVDILQLDPGSKDVGDSILIHQVHPAFRKEERSGVGRLVPFVVTWREIPYPRVTAQVDGNLISVGQVCVISFERYGNNMFF